MNQLIVPGRQHELDWLRVIAIFILMFFHTTRIFDMGPWHIKNNEVSENFIYWIPFLHSWRMPLILFISGAGSYFALGKSSPLRFSFERVKRLAIPTLFGMIIFLPPQTYYEHITEFSDYGEFYKSIFDFIPFYNGELNLYHLWFVAYLFAYSLIALPFLIFLRSTHYTTLRAKVLVRLFHPALLLSIPPTLIMVPQIILENYPARAGFALYLSFFLFGALLYSSPAYRNNIGKNRKYFFAAALLISLPYVLRYEFEGIRLLLNYPTIESALEITTVFVGWFWILTIVGYAQRYLNRSNPYLTKLNEGIYPFYILHQTVIVVIGYYICQLSWSISEKFWIINFLTIIICGTFYLLCIRPFNFMRIPFGMKLKRPKLWKAPKSPVVAQDL